MKRSRFDDNATGERQAEERHGYNEERRRDDSSYRRAPYPPPPHHRQNYRQGGASSSGHHQEPAVEDEDLLVCPTFESWRRSSSNTLGDSASQQDQIQHFCDFVKRWEERRTPKFVERHWFEDWFLERYDPERALARLADRTAQVQLRAKQISAQDVVPLTLPPNAVAAGGGEAASAVVVSGQELPMNDGCSAFLPSIPPTAPRLAMERVLREKHGAVALHIGEVNRSAKRRDLCRKGTVTFKDAQSARELVQLGHFSLWLVADADGVQLESTSEKDAKRRELILPVATSKPLPNRVLPADELERQPKDEAQAVACARVLDVAFCVDEAVRVDAFLANKPSEVSTLDAAVQYLRFVHLYCYFTGHRFADMGEMLQRSATPYLRAVGSNSHDAKFFESVDACAERILGSGGAGGNNAVAEELQQEQAKLAQAVQRKLAAVEESVEDFMRNNTIEVKKDDGNKTHYQCATHQKVFETEAFLRKHLTNFHSADMRCAARKPLVPLLQELMLADEDNKPLPRLPRFVEEALRNEFVPPLMRGGGGGGGGGRDDRQYQQHPQPYNSHQHHREEQQHHQQPQHQQQQQPVVRRYRDPDAVAAPTAQAAAAAGGKVKLQYRTRVSQNQ